MSFATGLKTIAVATDGNASECRPTPGGPVMPAWDRASSAEAALRQ